MNIVLIMLGFIALFVLVKLVLSIVNANVPQDMKNYLEEELPCLTNTDKLIEAAVFMENGDLILEKYKTAAQNVAKGTDPVRKFLKYHTWLAVSNQLMGAIIAIEAQKKEINVAL